MTWFPIIYPLYSSAYSFPICGNEHKSTMFSGNIILIYVVIDDGGGGGLGAFVTVI